VTSTHSITWTPFDGADFEIIPTNKVSPVRRLILFSPTCSLLLPWQTSPTSNVESEAANPVVSTPHMRTSEIPKPLLMSLVVTPPRHHLPALPSENGELPVLFLAEEMCAARPISLCTSEFCSFVHDLEVWYLISKSHLPIRVRRTNFATSQFHRHCGPGPFLGVNPRLSRRDVGPIGPQDVFLHCLWRVLVLRVGF